MSESKWEADGERIQVALTRFGSGPAMLLLPAISSISTRGEMHPLQERLGVSFSTVAIDWPGFGDLPRPRVDWRPDLYKAFLRFVLSNIIAPSTTVAAGHAAGYVLAEARDDPTGAGRLCLLSPTWRGPLPTMMQQRITAFRMIARAGDLPFAGSLLYHLNVNDFVIGVMARGHVYADPDWLTRERFAAKRNVTEAFGARHASFRFVAGELDPFASRDDFFDAARRVEAPVVLYSRDAPRKSKADMMALGSLANVQAVELPRGKLNFYEEFPDEVAAAIVGQLR